MKEYKYIYIILIVLLGLWFYWFQWRPAQSRAYCDKQARLRANEKAIIDIKRIGCDVNIFTNETDCTHYDKQLQDVINNRLFSKNDYEIYYRMCLNEKGIK